MYLYHYYEAGTRPFRNLSDLTFEEAEAVIAAIKRERPATQCAARHPSYNEDRRGYEAQLKAEFLKKGGLILREPPHYMTLGHSPWLSTWFERCAVIKIPIEEFDSRTLSFTYGDSHPIFSPRPNRCDGREYRRKLYTYEEILRLIDRYGYPQDWNDDGKYGPERYIEAHVWSDETVGRYMP